MWRQGAWPSALGFEIMCFNVESRFLPGADAAYVKAQTDKIIKEALRAHSSAHPFDRPPVGAWMDDATPTLIEPLTHRVATGRVRLRQLAIGARRIKQAALRAKIANKSWLSPGRMIWTLIR